MVAPVWAPYLYRVRSGRLQRGPIIYKPGDEVMLSYRDALSMSGNKDLEFIKVLPHKTKQHRHAVPGETLLKTPNREIDRIFVADLKKMALKELGLEISGFHQYRKESLRLIKERKYHVILATRRSRKAATPDDAH